MSALLGHLGVLRFAGADASTFLQGQVSNDTRRLDAREALLAACASVQGRVLAVLHLLPHTQGILAIVPRELIPGLTERLRRFVLRSKVQIRDLSEEWAVAGLSDAKALAAAGLTPTNAAGYLEQDDIGIASVHPMSARYWAVGPRSALEARGLTAGAPASGAASAGAPTAGAPTGGGAESDAAWRLADIRDGLPQIYAATSELFIAQMLNLDLIGGISFSKGCYTGQEIIARTQHLGRIKRRMFHLRLPRLLEIGAPLALTDGRTGRVVECVSVGEHCEALAVLSLEPGAAESEGSGAALAALELPLPYPLGAEAR